MQSVSDSVEAGTEIPRVETERRPFANANKNVYYRDQTVNIVPWISMSRTPARRALDDRRDRECGSRCKCGFMVLFIYCWFTRYLLPGCPCCGSFAEQKWRFLVCRTMICSPLSVRQTEMWLRLNSFTIVFFCSLEIKDNWSIFNYLIKLIT